MEIDEAIKNLQEHSALVLVAFNPTLLASVKLAIEALKAVTRLRNLFAFQSDAKLPGETKK